MWIVRDFDPNTVASTALPIKILKGPRQSGKTSLLARLGTHHLLYLDDAVTRLRADQDPRFLLDQLPQRLIIDEAPLAPGLFPELKRRVDEARRAGTQSAIDIWLTGSNQTLIQRSVRESLAGRASYFDFNTLSIHELADRWALPEYLIRGGWPELYASPQLDPVRYLNDLISTFIEHDIVVAAGIERRAAFLKVLHLIAGRTAQLFNASDIGVNAGVDSTTVQSWLSILETNGVVQKIPAYYTNHNKRLTKAPKYYFYDIGLATRLQGWSSAEPILHSSIFGHLFENIVLNEITRFFLNRGSSPSIYFIRSKEKVEVDFLVDLGNRRFLAVEAKVTPENYTPAQCKLLEGSQLEIVDRWIVAATESIDFPNSRVVSVSALWEKLHEVVC